MRKIFIALVCCLLLCSTAEATVTTVSGTLTIKNEQQASVDSPGNESLWYQKTHRYSDGRSEACANGNMYETRTSYDTIYHFAYYSLNGFGKLSTYTGTRRLIVGTATSCLHTEGLATGYGTPLEYSTVSCTKWGSGASPSRVNIVNCQTTNATMRGSNVTINGGSYVGQPAISSMGITVNKGTITDKKSTHSTFSLGDDSEQQVNQGSSTGDYGNTETTTITTVKLSNPPVIIDWADFPG